MGLDPYPPCRWVTHPWVMWPGCVGDLRILGSEGEILAFPCLCWRWVTVPTGLPGRVGDLRIWGSEGEILASALCEAGLPAPRLPAPDPPSLTPLPSRPPSGVLLLCLWGLAAVVPSHLPSHRLRHGLADQGLCGRPHSQVTCPGVGTALCFHTQCLIPFSRGPWERRSPCILQMRKLRPGGDVAALK